MSGQFISFEGLDGAGKTSVLNHICDELTGEMGDDGFLVTREPGGDRIADQIRKVILDKSDVVMDKWTEALLYAAARRQHVIQDIKPALDANKLVLCDRYLDSSLAYQGGGRQLGIGTIWQINKYAVQGCLPNLTIYLDVTVEEGLARIIRRQDKTLDRLDCQASSFYYRVRQAYLDLVDSYSERIVKVDASRSLSVVVDEVKMVIHSYFANLF